MDVLVGNVLDRGDGGVFGFISRKADSPGTSRPLGRIFRSEDFVYARSGGLGGWALGRGKEEKGWEWGGR